MTTQLTDREKSLLMGGGILIGIILIIWGVRSTMSWFDEIQNQKQAILNSRQEIEIYGKEYNLLKDLATQVGKKTQEMDITPIIEELLNKHQLTDKINHVNPSSSTVEKKIQEISGEHISTKSIC